MSLEHMECLKIKKNQMMQVFAKMITTALFLFFLVLSPSLSEDTGKK